MSEEQVWVAIGAGRATEEPSHIHIPRPSRVARPHEVRRATRGDRAVDAAPQCPMARGGERAAWPRGVAVAGVE